MHIRGLRGTTGAVASIVFRVSSSLINYNSLDWKEYFSIWNTTRGHLMANESNPKTKFFVGLILISSMSSDRSTI